MEYGHCRCRTTKEVKTGQCVYNIVEAQSGPPCPFSRHRKLPRWWISAPEPDDLQRVEQTGVNPETLGSQAREPFSFFFHFCIQHHLQSVRVGTEFGQYFCFSQPEYLTLTIHFGMLAAECFHCAIILCRVHAVPSSCLVPSN